MAMTRRNDPCPCGSGKRFKQCCGAIAEGQAGNAPAAAPSPLQEFNRALQLHQSGHLEQAEALYRQVLQAEPEHAEAIHFLGLIAHQTGKGEVAAELIDRAIRLNPTSQMHTNLGVVLQSLQRMDAAVESYRRAISLDPSFADPQYNLGLLYQLLGRNDEAVGCYERVLSLDSRHALAWNNLGEAMRELGRHEEALACYGKALALDPGFAGACNNMGVAYKEIGKVDDAVAWYRKALTLGPGDGAAHVHACVNLGNALADQGNIPEAIACHRKALELKPDDAEAYSSHLFTMAYQAALGPQAYLELARGWEMACVSPQERQAAAARRYVRRPLRDRRLRIGYVSGDYRLHAVGSFLKSILSLHDRARVEVFAYNTGGRQDRTTEEYRALVDHWASLVGLGDAAAARRIEADDIDVLVDLSGHTAHNRIGIFARRAAPVQAHYLGFCASTGISEIDHWIGDETLTPPETDAHFSERVWRLPRVWVAYEGRSDAPVPASGPDAGGLVRLGSFNNLAKINASTLALWAKVLLALPEGRLLLKTKDLADAANRRRVLAILAEHGVPAERVELQDATATPDWSSHMAHYRHLDVALDPIGGVGGGTTTCDALWMAVPVVTLCGDRMASRMTASMLHAIGHPEWIAASEDEYVRKVVALARDSRGREVLRTSLRDRMARSPLCDTGGLTRCLEDAFFGMFRRWLERDSARPGALPARA